MMEASFHIGIYNDNATTVDHAVTMWRAQAPAYLYISSDGTIFFLYCPLDFPFPFILKSPSSLNTLPIRNEAGSVSHAKGILPCRPCYTETFNRCSGLILFDLVLLGLACCLVVMLHFILFFLLLTDFFLMTPLTLHLAGPRKAHHLNGHLSNPTCTPRGLCVNQIALTNKCTQHHERVGFLDSSAHQLAALENVVSSNILYQVTSPPLPKKKEKKENNNSNTAEFNHRACSLLNHVVLQFAPLLMVSHPFEGTITGMARPFLVQRRMAFAKSRAETWAT